VTPTWALSLAIEPKTDADRLRLGQGLRMLEAEDPTLCVVSEPEAGPVVIGAMGELQLEIVIDRLKREFNVEASVGRPRVAYREALTRQADGEMKYTMHFGGRGEYSHVKIHLSPGEPGSGYIFEDQIVAGAIPKAFITAVDEGIRESLTHGVLAGYPVDDVHVELYDGSYHDVDSSEAAFKVAAAMALRDAARKAEPVLLEPVMRVEVAVPSDYVDDITENLSSRRGQIQSQEHRGGAQVISARVPLSEMFGYGTDLRSRTYGQASFSMHFDGYEPLPDDPRGPDDPMVRSPLRPVRPSRSSAAAAPEPNGTDQPDD
jgi:elongation factor G